jgi:hemin uptake protein HemP
LIRQRHAEGVFTDAEHDDLADLLKGKAEIIIGHDNGQEFSHEAAEHEVTA